MLQVKGEEVPRDWKIGQFLFSNNWYQVRWKEDAGERWNKLKMGGTQCYLQMGSKTAEQISEKR